MRASVIILALISSFAPGALAGQPPAQEKALAVEQEAALPPGRRLVLGSNTSAAGPERWQTYLLYSRPILSDENVRRAEVQINEMMGAPEVALAFDEAGTEAFARQTAALVGRRLAIVLDDEVMSAPVIMSAIPGGRAVISLGASRSREETLREARVLAATLNSHALPCPLEPLAEKLSQIGLQLDLQLDLATAVREDLQALAWRLQDALAQAGLSPTDLRPVDGRLRLRLSDARQVARVSQALSLLPGPWALQTSRDPADPRLLWIERPPDRRAALLDRARSRTARILDQRLEGAGVRGHRIRIVAPDHLIVDLPAVPDGEQIKRLLYTRGRLEFLAVDDESDLHLRLRHRLPAEVRLEFGGYHGPGDQGPRQTSAWVSDGPAGRTRLLDFIRTLDRSSTGSPTGD